MKSVERKSISSKLILLFAALISKVLNHRVFQEKA
jgi:hypothetical protein